MFTAPVGMLKHKGGAPTFVHASPVVILNGGNNSIVVPNPGTQFGDVMLFFFWGEQNNTQINSGPVGWTQQVSIIQTFNGQNYHFDMWDHGALGGEPGSYQWNLQGGAGNKGGVILVYRPANLIQPDVIGNTPVMGPGSPLSQSSVTTLHPNTTTVWAWGLVRAGNNPLTTPTLVVPLVQRVYTDYSIIGAPWLGLAIGDQTIASAGSTGIRSLATIDANVNSSGSVYGARA